MRTDLTPHPEHWYSRISQQDRAQVDALARWLHPVQWQLFVTLTFTWNVSSETADSKLREFLNAVEKDLRTKVCFVAGKERKPNSFGMEVPWHFHLLMTASCMLPPRLIEIHWTNLVGAGPKRQGQKDGDSVVVKLFDKERRGAEYCLKLINDCHGD